MAQISYTLDQMNEAIRKGISRYISHTYVADGAETPISLVANTPKKYPLPVTIKEINGFGIFDPGGPAQALEFQATGIVDKLFRLDGSTSLVTTTNNCNVWLYLYLNGEPVAACVIQRKIGTGADTGSMSLDSTFRASTGNLLDVYVKSDLDTDMTFKLTSIFIEEV